RGTRWVCWRTFHRADETVAATRQGLNKPWIVSIVSQREADLGNGCIQRLLKINKGIFRPDFLAQLFPSHQLARAFQQQGTDLKRLALQGHLDPILVQFPGLKVRFKDSETNNLRRTSDLDHGQHQPVNSNSSILGRLIQIGPVQVLHPNRTWRYRTNE